MKNFASGITLLLAVLTLLSQPAATGADSQVITYPFPPDLAASSRFHVTVDGQPVFTHAAEVADFAMFAIRGPVQVTVACEQPVTSAIVRPRARNIVPQWEAKHRSRNNCQVARERQGASRRYCGQSGRSGTGG